VTITICLCEQNDSNKRIVTFSEWIAWNKKYRNNSGSDVASYNLDRRCRIILDHRIILLESLYGLC